jgi:hypothetical protein
LADEQVELHKTTKTNKNTKTTKNTKKNKKFFERVGKN